MSKQNLLNIADLMIEVFYSAIVFLTPLYFAFFLTNNNVFALNKIVFFKVLTSLLAAAFVLKVIIHPSELRNVWAKIKGKKYLLLPVLFLLSLGAVTLVSSYQELSFFGLYSRQEGLVSYIYYFIFFLLLIFTVNDFNQLKRLFIGIGISSFVVSGYALLQIVGIDIFDWNEPAVLTGRATSTLGQPNYLGSFLLLALPFPAYLLYKHRKDRWLYLWMLVVVANVAALYFTKSAAAWMGLAASIAVIFLVYGFYKIRTKKRKIGAAIILAVLALLATYSVIGTLTSTQFFKTGSVAARLNIWRASVQAIGERPITGWGLDAQNNALAPRYERDWAVYGNVNVIPSRAHNVFLDILLIGGLICLIFYLALLYVFAKMIFENLRHSFYYKQHTIKAVNLLLLGGLVGYMVSLMFGFAVVTTHVYFWFYLAVLIIINDRLKTQEPAKKGIASDSRRFILVKSFLLILVIAGVGVHSEKQIDQLKADHYFKYIKEADANDEYSRVLKLHNYIEQLNIRDKYYDRKTSLIVARMIEDMKDSPVADLGKDVLEATLKNVKDSARYPDIYAKGQIYTALASPQEPQYFELAERAHKELLSRAPAVPENHQAYAKMLAKEGRYGEALEHHREALKRLPAVNHPYINREHAQRVKYEKYLNYKSMADIYFAQEEYKQARKYYRLAYDNNLSQISLYKKIADTYYKEGKLKKAIQANERGYARSLEDHIWPFAMALLYKEKGDKQKSLEYGKEALELAPDNKQIKKFISKLK